MTLEYTQGSYNQDTKKLTMGTVTLDGVPVTDEDKKKLIASAAQVGKCTAALSVIISKLRAEIGNMQAIAADYGGDEAFYSYLIELQKFGVIDKLVAGNTLSWTDIGCTYRNAVYTFTELVAKLNPATNTDLSPDRILAMNRCEQGANVNL